MAERQSEVLFAEERRAAIVNLVNKNKKVLVPELVDVFKVSPATIRGDLRDLEAASLIKRTHGGAIPVNSVKVGFEPVKRSKQVDRLAEKKSIAKHAADLVEDGDIIILDTGTTLHEMARLLDGKENVTVIVNDLEIALLLEAFDDIHVVVIGGVLRKKFSCTVGPFATSLLSGLNVDKAFLGTNAFSAQKGATTPDINQAEVKKMMVKVASQVILLCDSSKLGKNSFVPFALPEDIHTLITDGGIPPATVRELSDLGMDVRVAGS